MCWRRHIAVCPCMDEVLMPVEGDVVGVEVDGRHVRGRILRLDYRTVSVAYDGLDGVLVQISSFPLLGVRFPQRVRDGQITQEGVAEAESLLRGLARGVAFVAAHRPALEAIVREIEADLRKRGAWDGAMTDAEADAARRAVRAARRHAGLHQNAARAKLRAIDERARIASGAWCTLLSQVADRIEAAYDLELSRTVLKALVAAAVPHAATERAPFAC